MHVLLLWLVGHANGSNGAAPIELTINVTAPSAMAPPHLASLGWEVHWMLSALDNMTVDGRVASIMSHLAPAVVRVGGISCDWVRYVLDNVTYPPPSGPGVPTWFSAPFNMSLGTLYRLDGLLHAADLSFALDLSELYGRVCNNSNPSDPSDNQWCTGDWDTSNLHALLQRLHDDDVVDSPQTALFAFELGNELTGHISRDTNLQDIATAAEMLANIWADKPAPPPLYAPAISDPSQPDALPILLALPSIPAVTGFSFHSYPLGNGGEGLAAKLLNASWLRSGAIGSAPPLLDAWSAPGGPRSRGLGIWVTEASSSYNWAVPPPGQNSVLNNYFTVAQYGQYAPTGVGFVARWSFNEPNPFATIIQNGTRWDVAADFWLLKTIKALLGPEVLAVTGDEGSGVAAFAYCLLTGSTRRNDSMDGSGGEEWRWDLSQVRHPLAGTPPRAGVSSSVKVAGNGSVVLVIANPSLSATTVTIPGLRTTPRLDWAFTAPGGPADLSSTTPVLNAFDNGGTLLRVSADGSLPPMPGFYVASSASETLTLPPRSQLFSVFLEAAAPACLG